MAYTDAIKKEIATYLQSKDPRVLNGLGPFASLYDLDFPEIKDPVLVLKTEEPGSKQKLAMQYGFTESICHDMINHLVNDIAVMGAKPLAVLDCIVCSAPEKETIKTLLKEISNACRENECSLVGGETSIQPQVVEKGTYILSSSIAGIVSRRHVIDGHTIQSGDMILGVASNGLHTNGYSLVRMLLEKMPQIKFEKIHGETFFGTDHETPLIILQSHQANPFQSCGPWHGSYYRGWHRSQFKPCYSRRVAGEDRPCEMEAPSPLSIFERNREY